MSGLDFQNNGLESSDDLTGLLRVRTRSDLQVNVGSRHRELLKEDIGHVEVVMLAGVNQRLPHMIVLTDGLNDRRGFHKVRPRSDYMDNVHIEIPVLRPDFQVTTLACVGHSPRLSLAEPNSLQTSTSASIINI